jgi:PIN domain nuclease of toxin-antitoxin system
MNVLEASGFAWINLKASHITRLQSLPMLHSDPFDRLLVAQAKAEKFEFITLDSQLSQYF